MELWLGVKVTLLNYTRDGVKLIADAVRVTGPFFEKREDTDLVRYMVKHDFGSVLEHVSFTFELKDISIAISRELLEHRIASHTARSTRYSNEEEASFYYPKFNNVEERELYTNTLQHVRKQYLKLRDQCGYEVARYVLPLATCCTYVWTINARSLTNFLRLRLCKNAAPEMQELARNVKDLVAKIYPEIFESIECRGSQYGVCPEPKARSCGKYPPSDKG